MLTLIMGIACMIIGYVLGSIDTDKKWVSKTKDNGDSFVEVQYRDGTVETIRIPGDGSKVMIEKEIA